jgi:tetratricopeptide (TPR) repeat protein
MFEVTCDNCGAISPGTIEACPFCHSRLTPEAAKPHPAATARPAAPPPDSRPSAGNALVTPVHALYREGKVDRAIGLLNQVVKQRPEILDDPANLLLNVKILLETEGSVAAMKSLLERALALAPQRPELVEYREVVEAKGLLDVGARPKAEEMLRKLITRYPRNEHALLILGTHLFWSRGDIDQAMRYLENCVSIRPVMLKGWACLGAVYSTMGRDQVAAHAFRKCLELETHPKMIAYFQSILKGK